MIAETWASNGLAVTVDKVLQTGTNAYNLTGPMPHRRIFASAQRSDDGTAVLIRVAAVNATSVRLSLRGKPVSYTHLTLPTKRIV